MREQKQEFYAYFFYLFIHSFFFQNCSESVKEVLHANDNNVNSMRKLHFEFLICLEVGF